MPHIGEKIRIYFPTMREADVITMTNTRGSSGEMATTNTLNKPTIIAKICERTCSAFLKEK